jgi:ABC-type oligopeptide transport system substrate-binding subunit
MGRYILRRLLESAVTFILVTIVVFIGVRALPGDPARTLAGEESDPQTLVEIRHSFGLDQPVPVQYVKYVANALHGDLGRSSRTGLPVSSSIAHALPVTLQLVPTEFAASLDQTDAGDYQMFLIGWSGRVDPDGNIANFVGSQGSQNNNGYSSTTVDALLAQTRSSNDVTARRDLYGKVITELHKDVPIIYLYRVKNFTGVAKTVVGVQMFGDGLMRFGHAGFAA